MLPRACQRQDLSGILPVLFHGQHAIVRYAYPFFRGGQRTVWIDLAYAQGTTGAGRGAGDIFNSLFLFVPLILIFYFLIFRPQQKQRKEFQAMVENLKRGDRIITRGGIEATVDKIEEKSLRLDLGNGLKLKMRRDYVDQVIKESPSSNA